MPKNCETKACDGIILNGCRFRDEPSTGRKYKYSSKQVGMADNDVGKPLFEKGASKIEFEGLEPGFIATASGRDVHCEWLSPPDTRLTSRKREHFHNHRVSVHTFREVTSHHWSEVTYNG